MLCNNKIIGIYCLVDDLLKGIGHKEDSRRKVSDSEIITTAIVSALYFGGHLDNARHMMEMTRMVPDMLDKSRFCRRLHALESLLCMIFFQVGQHIKDIAGASDYVVDSFPVSVCDNIRIARCRMLKGKQWRGKQCSMRRYFYGVKVQVLTTTSGIPVEFCFVPGSESDVQALKKLPMTVSAESNIYADSAYTDYTIEDDMKDADFINLLVQRKSNAKRKSVDEINTLEDLKRMLEVWEVIPFVVIATLNTCLNKINIAASNENQKKAIRSKNVTMNKNLSFRVLLSILVITSFIVTSCQKENISLKLKELQKDSIAFYYYPDKMIKINQGIIVFDPSRFKDSIDFVVPPSDKYYEWSATSSNGCDSIAGEKHLSRVEFIFHCAGTYFLKADIYDPLTHSLIGTTDTLKIEVTSDTLYPTQTIKENDILHVRPGIVKSWLDPHTPQNSPPDEVYIQLIFTTTNLYDYATPYIQFD